jgi:hypothetical protein
VGKSRPVKTPPASVNRSGRLQRGDDLVHHRHHISVHRPIPEPQHTAALALQNRSTYRIVLDLALICVLTSVELNDKPPIDAYEIQKVAAKRGLPTEMEAAFPESLQPGPQPTLLQRHRFP